MRFALAIFAHFKLLEPSQNGSRGQPVGRSSESPGPCGLEDTSGENAKLLTNASTKVTGGSKFHLKIQETIYHSGHYRVALAVNSPNRSPTRSGRRGEVDRGGVPLSMGADSESPADPSACRRPVPALSETRRTGLEACQSEVADDLGNGSRTPEYQLPKCTLQVVEFMADHPYNVPGGYSYHHCAAIRDHRGSVQAD